MKKSINVIAKENGMSYKEVETLFKEVKEDGVSTIDGKTKLYSDETIKRVLKR